MSERNSANANDDLLARWQAGPDQPPAHEPSLVRGEGFVPRLEIQDVDGNRRSLPYAALAYIYFNPSEGITLVFARPDCVVKLGGENLQPLYLALHQHAVKTIRVISGPFPSSETAVTRVTSCQMNDDPEAAREDDPEAG